MGGVTVTVMHVVGVVLVRHGDMTAALAVLVFMTVVGGMTGGGALVDVTVVDPVDVAVVREVGVVLVREGDVAAALTVGVRVVLVRAVIGGGGHGGTPCCSCRSGSRPPLSHRTTHRDISI
jgi:hypothetical protein